MRKKLIALALVAGMVAACSGSAATGNPQTAGAPTGGVPIGPSQAAPGATSNAPVDAPKQIDPCSLLTTAEAAAVLGKPVDPGAPPEAGSSSCLFTTSGLSLDSIEISVTPSSGSGFNPSQKSIPGLTITPVSGIGDAAYYVSMGAGHVVLNFKKGQNTFSSSVLLKGASDSLLMAGEKSLAITMMSHL
jgi:Protein of unknown function (DUF3558)